MKRSLKFIAPVLFLGFSAGVTPQVLAQNSSPYISSMKIGMTAVVGVDTTNVRSAAKNEAQNILGKMRRGDLVEVVGFQRGSGMTFAEVKVIQSSNFSAPEETKLYIAQQNLSVDVGSSTAANKYFIIQNIATEKTRVYERCTTTPDCAHTLVMETDMAVGRPEGGKENPTQFMTAVGLYSLESWVKFYEDYDKDYPSWYDPTYPELPERKGNSKTGETKNIGKVFTGPWLKKDLLPQGKGTYRGAFGWYAATVSPHDEGQWIHGTFGYGADGDHFINRTRSGWANMWANPRSAGCTRLENRAVAYLRHLVPVGTQIIRVYAREGARDLSFPNYNQRPASMPWQFALTKEDVRQNGGSSADKASVLARNVPDAHIIEYGTYPVDMKPTVMPLKLDANEGDAQKGRSGNIYLIPNSAFKGVLLVDEGRLVGYEHPTHPHVKVQGRKAPGVRTNIPNYAKAEGAFTAPTTGRDPNTSTRGNNRNRNR